jgi:hypothetical protein
MPLNMKLPFAHSNVAAVEVGGAWPVVGFIPATNRCMVGLQVVLLSAPTSIASIIVVGPHHAAVTHVGGRQLRSGPSGAHGSAGYSQKVLI